MSELSPQDIERYWQDLRECIRVLRQDDPAYFTRLVRELQAIEPEVVQLTRPYPEPLDRAG